jgi:hypothetical protein
MRSPQRYNERVSTDGIILKAQAVQFNRLLSKDEIFELSEKWLWKWRVQHGISQFNTGGEATPGDSAAAEVS